jgi:hypothetical protein
MIEFLNGKKVETLADYNLYTHYVAGLVGLGLTDLFLASGLEPALSALDASKRTHLANSMGLFLQKVNITRDFTEDRLDGRFFWPREIYGLYGKDLSTLHETPERARACLNHMCADAMDLVPECLEYLSLLREPSIFAFCAIPQVPILSFSSISYNRLTISLASLTGHGNLHLFPNPRQPLPLLPPPPQNPERNRSPAHARLYNPPLRLFHVSVLPSHHALEKRRRQGTKWDRGKARDRGEV